MSGVGGADWVRIGGDSGARWVGVVGDVLGADWLITIERYLSAMLVPEEEGFGAVVVSRLEERTNSTRLRRTPELKGRCCSGGRK